MPDYHSDLAFSRTLLEVRDAVDVLAVGVFLAARPEAGDRGCGSWRSPGISSSRRSTTAAPTSCCCAWRGDGASGWGQLGSILFEKGHYVYTGSAMAQPRREGWHGTAAGASGCTGTSTTCARRPTRWCRCRSVSSRRLECDSGRRAGGDHGRRACRGFGSSDCECRSHLFPQRGASPSTAGISTSCCSATACRGPQGDSGSFDRDATEPVIPVANSRCGRPYPSRNDRRQSHHRSQRKKSLSLPVSSPRHRPRLRRRDGPLRRRRPPSTTTPMPTTARAVAAEVTGPGGGAPPCSRRDVSDRGAVEGMIDGAIDELGPPRHRGLQLLLLQTGAVFSSSPSRRCGETLEVTLLGVVPHRAARGAPHGRAGRRRAHPLHQLGALLHPDADLDAVQHRQGRGSTTWPRPSPGSWPPHRIRVNVIEPGWTDTPGERQFSTEEELREGGKELRRGGRLGTIEDLGKAAAFLSSDAADYITAATLRVDGGILGEVAPPVRCGGPRPRPQPEHGRDR